MYLTVFLIESKKIRSHYIREVSESEAKIWQNRKNYIRYTDWIQNVLTFPFTAEVTQPHPLPHGSETLILLWLREIFLGGKYQLCQ